MTDWHDLIARDDVDVVDICTPPGTHAEIAQAAAAAGKAVLCEKPLAVSYDRPAPPPAPCRRPASATPSASTTASSRRWR